MIIAKFHPTMDNIVWWSRSINEEQIIVSDLIIDKVFLIILLLVKSYYSFDTKLPKDFYVLIWMMTISLVLVSFFNWPHESHKFAWDDPIQVSIFDSFILLVLFDVEGFEFIPVEFNSIL
jgi:hypothetical protein